MVDIAERVKMIRAVDARIDEIETQHKDKLAPFSKLKEKLKGEILHYLHSTNQKSAKTEFGSVGWYVRRTLSVEDQAEFRRHVIGGEEWGLIKWSVLPTAATAYEEKNGMLPPGVKDSKIEMLSITAPPKPKLRTAKADGAEVEDTQEQVETL